MSGKIVQTTNENLQKTLNAWVEELTAIVQIKADNSNKEQIEYKLKTIDTFVRSFVPLDVTEDDIAHYSGLLQCDQVTIQLFLFFLFFLFLSLYLSGIFGCFVS